MDFLNKFANQTASSNQSHSKPPQSSSGSGDLLGKFSSFSGNNDERPPQQQESSSAGAGGFLDKLHGAVGGGPESEKKEDALDKGIDWVQENVLKQGAQSNESATEQAKDGLIANTIRDQYKKATGNDFPIKDKEKKSSGFGSSFGL